ncbi:MAG: carboxypeptidase Taq [Solirubrobacteraceae bacterium]|nr:carboxypeptidase Taq [Solirubrobacteraceae bacterium]
MAVAVPAELGALREQLAELADIQGAMAILSWDQNVCMPAAGHATRADQMATLERLAHTRLVSPDVARLLEALEPWAASEDPDSDDVRLVRVARRDHEKSAAVPEQLAVEMARAASNGYGAWLAARENGDFSRFAPALERQVELRRQYVACFTDAAHPYDVLLDDFEPGITLAEVRPLFATLVAGLQPLLAAANDVPNSLQADDLPIADQRTLLREVLGLIGFDSDSWRLDDTAHPFAQSSGVGDVRITTRYSATDLGSSLYSGLHEFGHGLYEASFAPALARTPLYDAASLGMHESQSRMWENLVGRGRPFATWVLPHLQEHLPGAYGAMDVDTFYRGLNCVQRTLIRTEADETTYNLHVALRLELELGLLENRLEVPALPEAWNEGMHRLLGVEVPSDAQGVLQDVHWSSGLFGYFPTYTLGNVMAAQLWAQLRQDIPDVDERIEAGDFAPLREWLREHIHRHGRKYTQRELLRRATRQEIDVQPFLDYLGTKLRDAGVIPA